MFIKPEYKTYGNETTVSLINAIFNGTWWPHEKIEKDSPSIDNLSGGLLLSRTSCQSVEGTFCAYQSCEIRLLPECSLLDMHI